MKAILTLLILFGVSVFSAPGFASEGHEAAGTVDDFFTLAAADGVTDEFGDYFTAATPDALTDNGGEFSAEDLGNIEPAAGGESPFLLPGDEPASDLPAMTEDGRLATPETPPVPGMETQP